MLRKIILKEDNKYFNLKKGQIIYIESKNKINLKEAIVNDIAHVTSIIGKKVVKIKYNILNDGDSIADIYFDNDINIVLHLSIEDDNQKQEYIKYLLDSGAYYEEHQYEYEGGQHKYKILVLDINK